MKQRFNLALHLLLLVGILSACGPGSSSTDSAEQATLEAISAAVRGTATVEAAAKANPDAPVETAQAEATLQSQAINGAGPGCGEGDIP